MVKSTGETRSASQPVSTDWSPISIDVRGFMETILHFEVPRLGEAADELYRQQEFWPSRPAAEDTGLDLLCDTLGDVSAHKADSDRFDSPLLGRISRLGGAFDRGYQRAVFVGDRYTEEHPAVLDEVTIANAQQLTRETPRPQRLQVVGVLAMICMSSHGFELLLDDGSRARSVLVEGDMAAIQPLCGNHVLVQGLAICRASGRLLRIDADRIEAGKGLSTFWSVIVWIKGNTMDPGTIVTFFRPRGDMAKPLPINSLARQQIELLKEQINLLKRQHSALKTEKDESRSKVDALTKELSDLQEQFDSSQLMTDEFEEDPYVWQMTPLGKTGPYCPSHRDVRLVQAGSAMMGMYCPKCRVPIRAC